MLYTLEQLRDEYRKGNKSEFVFFWKIIPTADRDIGPGCFSQWLMRDFVIDEVIYSCAEQYMMAEKARLFNDEKMLAAIMASKSPKEMKAYGQSVKHFDQYHWNNNCYDIVKRASYAKFTQNPDLLEFILSTQNKILVEASPLDRIWGIGMAENDPDIENPLKWRGQNLLGFALTETRDTLMNKEL